MDTSCTLLIALLSIQSSYAQNVERPREAIPDTVQFYFCPAAADWRIRTMAIDHDIHVHLIRPAEAPRTFDVGAAERHVRKLYGEVLERLVVVTLPDPGDHRAVEALLANEGLDGAFEVGKSGVAFYNPDRARYWSQSTLE